MATPAVSFIVPCFKLAHLLPECINSILSQTYPDFEVLIMDDCSPDNTGEVAQSFHDSRVRHIRNPKNLGHLQNYNKGISLSRGRYVWLISADDYLRAPYILERYIDLLDSKPRIGYTFCAGFSMQSGIETQVVGHYPGREGRDSVIPGHVMLKNLLRCNFVLAASGLVRRKCYDELSVFPLNMPWAGDWYLWCLFALYYDVGYFAEPMVCYRDHSLSMTTKLTKEKLEACAGEDIAIPWIIRKRAQEAGYLCLAKELLPAIAHTYARVMASELYRESGFMSIEKFEYALSQNLVDETERDLVRALTYADMGNEYYRAGNTVLAKKFYEEALRINSLMGMVHIKNIFLCFGKAGNYLRRLASHAVRLVSRDC